MPVPVPDASLFAGESPVLTDSPPCWLSSNVVLAGTREKFLKAVGRGAGDSTRQIVDLADLANGFANSNPGWAWIRADRETERPGKQRPSGQRG